MYSEQIIPKSESIVFYTNLEKQHYMQKKNKVNQNIQK